MNGFAYVWVSNPRINASCMCVHLVCSKLLHPCPESWLPIYTELIPVLFKSNSRPSVLGWASKFQVDWTFWLDWNSPGHLIPNLGFTPSSNNDWVWLSLGNGPLIWEFHGNRFSTQELPPSQESNIQDKEDRVLCKVGTFAKIRTERSIHVHICSYEVLCTVLYCTYLERNFTSSKWQLHNVKMWAKHI